MAGAPFLKVGEVVVTGGDYGSFSWPQTLGVAAPRVVWRLPVADATKILAGPREVTIHAKAPDGKELKIERVYVVGEDHSPDALVRAVVLSDVRFYLPFAWVRASYNVRVQSGTYRQVAADAQPTAAPPPTVRNWTLAPYSLSDGAGSPNDGPEAVPWTAHFVARHILKLATEGHDFQAIKVRYLARERTTFTPNDVYVDASGEAAIGQTLGALGGLDLRVADDGAIEVVDAFLGAEKETVDPVVRDYSLERKGVLRWISMANVAPRAASVLITRRVELRVDSFEGAPGSDGNASTVGDDVTWGVTGDPTMINVIPVTDLSLPYPSAQSPSIQGTLVPLSRYCKAVGDLNDSTAGTPRAARTLTRQYLLAGPGGKSASPLLSETLDMVYVEDHGTGVGPNVLWGARVAALKNFVRTLYQIDPLIARQCVPGSIKAERVGLLDAATGTRQPATVYMDYVQRPVGPHLATSDKYGWQQNSVPPSSPNVQAFPTGSKSYTENGGPYNKAPFRLTSAQPAPFQVQCTDPTTGVFFFSPSAQDTSKIKHAAQLHPGLVWGLPTTKSGDLNRGVAVSMWSQAKKLLTHRVALVFSAVPGGPNGPTSLHRYDITVSEALGRLGAKETAVSPRAPRREMRIRDGVALARIPWDDDRRRELLGCFWLTGTSDPSRLVPVNDRELRDFAVSCFANYMACVLDHYEGDMTIGFAPKIKPIGSLRQVSHQFLPDGSIYTTLRADGVTPPTPPENLISQSSRNILFRGIS